MTFPDHLSEGEVSLRSYQRSDADALFVALSDERVWEHIPRDMPADAAALDAAIRANLEDGDRQTLVIRVGDQVVGTTSVMFDPTDPDGVEIGATQLDPSVWGSGANGAGKRLLLAALFAQGARWVQLRTDERNLRSAAAIRKLGARDLGIRPDRHIRRDGTRRRSHFFRVERPAGTVGP